MTTINGTNERRIPHWVEYFLSMAKVAATRSNCIRANVGAIITDGNNHIKSSGYNGSPSGVKSCFEKNSCYRIENNIESGTRYELCQSIHAEQNAIIQAGADNCKDGVIYVYGHDMICVLCKRFIIQSGLRGVWLQKNETSHINYISIEDLKASLGD